MSVMLVGQTEGAAPALGLSKKLASPLWIYCPVLPSIQELSVRC